MTSVSVENFTGFFCSVCVCVCVCVSCQRQFVLMLWELNLQQC